MITITLRFYAELNDRLPPDKRKVDFQFSLPKEQSIADLIESLNIPLSDVDRILANGEPVDVSYTVQDGDRFSIYPELRSLV
jgi:sulfur carrier protein ThiS